MGAIYSLLCALIWAFAVIFLKNSMAHVSPWGLNLFRTTFGMVAIGLTLLFTGEVLWQDATWQDYALLGLSGAIGIALSDTLFHKSLDLVGASISAIIDCIYSPSCVIFAYLFLHESMSRLQILGMIFVLAGIVIASYQGNIGSIISRKHFILGVVLGVLAMITVAIGLVIAKPVLNKAPVLWVTLMRQFFAFWIIIGISLFSKDRKQILSVLVPSRAWKSLVPGGFLGSYLALIVWFAGMKYTNVGVAAILNQTSTIFVIILARIFLKEAITKRKVVACLVAISGIVLVTV